VASGGRNVGTLCIADQTPRPLTARELEALADLAAIVEREFSMSPRLEEQRSELEIKDELDRTQADLVRLCSQLQNQKQKADRLLLNILPEPVAAELRDNGSVQAV